MGAKVVSLQEDRVDPALKQALFALSVAMGLVLLIACVNVIGLLLVRVNSRGREAALRIALGVTRGRLVRLFLVESTLLALLGGGLGLVMARFGIRLAAIFGPSKGPLGETASQPVAFQSVELGTGVFVVTLLLTLVVGFFVGIIPAIQSSRVDVNSWLKEGTRGSGSRSSLRRVTPLSVLVVVEVALSLVLLIGAGLMIRSFVRLANQDLGVDPDHVLTMKIAHAYRGEESEASRIFHEQVQERLKQIPGIEAVSMTNRLPLSVEGEGSNITVEGRDPEVDGESFVGIHMVGAEHFDTLGIPILRGRSFDSSDRRDTPRVAILSETAARRIFPREDPIGRRIRLGIGWEEGEYAEVVGVVGDVQYGRIEDEMEAHVYVPFLQQPYPYFYLLVKSREEANVMMPLIRDAVQELNPELPIFDVKPLADRFADYLARYRFTTFLITLFAAIAALLASVGLYGIMAYSLSGRTQELGVRKALGASSGSLFRLILGEGLVLLFFGLAVGTLLAFPLTRLLNEFLFELEGRDPLSFASAALLLLAAGLLASLAPVLKAIRVEPKESLRYE
jgi:putative ABC transport system permease protein